MSLQSIHAPAPHHRFPLALTALAVLALVLGTPAAIAGHDDDEYDDRDRHGRRHVHGDHPAPRYAVRHPHALPPPLVAPIVLRHASVQAYAPYYRGSVYFEPHGHHHAVYHFPVRTGYGYAPYTPHHYCRGTLVGPPVVVEPPRLSIRLSF
jgi:hypothetical protein